MSTSEADDAGETDEGEVRKDSESASPTEPHTSELGAARAPSGRRRSERVSVVLSILAVAIAAMSALFSWQQADEAKRQADAAQHANDLADSATARKIRVGRIGGLDNAFLVANQSDQRAESMWLEGRNSVVNLTINPIWFSRPVHSSRPARILQ